MKKTKKEVKHKPAIPKSLIAAQIMNWLKTVVNKAEEEGEGEDSCDTSPIIQHWFTKTVVQDSPPIGMYRPRYSLVDKRMSNYVSMSKQMKDGWWQSY